MKFCSLKFINLYFESVIYIFHYFTIKSNKTALYQNTSLHLKRGKALLCFLNPPLLQDISLHD